VVSEELGVHILQLPYKGEDISMYILLPPFVSSQQRIITSDERKIDGVRQFLQRIADNVDSASELRDILDNGMPSRDVELAIPKFSLESEIPVKELLQAMGAGIVFDTSADFGGFTADGETSVHLGDAIHRAKIDVTEEGTTAAAATALFSFRSSRPTEPAYFTANHPFVYFIYDKPSRLVLFAGIFRKPNKK
jgi:serine protease inhibitor